MLASFRELIHCCCCSPSRPSPSHSSTGESSPENNHFPPCTPSDDALLNPVGLTLPSAELDTPPTQREMVQSCLLPRLIPDVIPIIVGYLISLDLTLLRSFGGYGDNDGKMRNPSSICLHKDELFVADLHNDRIQVFHELTGRYLRQWRTNQWPTFGPSCVLVFKDEVLVSHRDGSGHIQAFRLSDSSLLPSWNLPESMDRESGHAMATDGESLFISDGVGQIYVCSPSQRWFRGSPGYRPGELRKPSKLFIVEDQVFHADTWNGCVQVFSKTSGKYLHQYTSLSLPQAVTVDNDEVIVCTTEQDGLVVFDRSSRLPIRAITKLNAPLLRRPSDLAINSKQQLLVCTSESHCILVFQ